MFWVELLPQISIKTSGLAINLNRYPTFIMRIIWGAHPELQNAGLKKIFECILNKFLQSLNETF
jgi:hypothetical protein